MSATAAIALEILRFCAVDPQAQECRLTKEQATALVESVDYLIVCAAVEEAAKEAEGLMRDLR